MPRLALVTCEHGGHRVPRPWASLFTAATATLRTHRGYDAGALQVARLLARRFDVPLVASTTTRLLVDLNRSRANPQVFSEFTRALPQAQRERLLRRYHDPHRAAILRSLQRHGRQRGDLLHVASHSFTPIWKGRRRACDIGLLYDPSRPREAAFVRLWRRALQELRPRLRVRLNQPYRGWTDGLTTFLRAALPAHRYLGIELEVNQRLVRAGAARWRHLQRDLVASLETALSRSD